MSKDEKLPPLTRQGAFAIAKYLGLTLALSTAVMTGAYAASQTKYADRMANEVFGQTETVESSVKKSIDSITETYHNH